MRRITIEDYKSLASYKKYQFPGDKIPRNCTVRSPWVCFRGHTWMARYADIKRGIGCAECYKRQLEYKEPQTERTCKVCAETMPMDCFYSHEWDGRRTHYNRMCKFCTRKTYYKPWKYRSEEAKARHRASAKRCKKRLALIKNRCINCGVHTKEQAYHKCISCYITYWLHSQTRTLRDANLEYSKKRFKYLRENTGYLLSLPGAALFPNHRLRHTIFITHEPKKSFDLRYIDWRPSSDKGRNFKAKATKNV